MVSAALIQKVSRQHNSVDPVLPDMIHDDSEVASFAVQVRRSV